MYSTDVRTVLSMLILTDHREIVGGGGGGGGGGLPTAAQSVVNYAWSSAKLHLCVK